MRRGGRARCALHPRLPWVFTHGCVMPPLRGSGINNASTVGSAHDVRVTHGCVMSPPCGSVLYHRYAALYYVTATRFCIMSPLRGSHGCFRFPWVPRTMCASPTAVLCHRHAVRYYVTAMRFCVMSPPCGSVLCHRDAVRCYVTAMRFCVIPPLRGSYGGVRFFVVFNGISMQSRCPDMPIPQ